MSVVCQSARDLAKTITTMVIGSDLEVVDEEETEVLSCARVCTVRS